MLKSSSLAPSHLKISAFKHFRRFLHLKNKMFLEMWKKEIKFQKYIYSYCTRLNAKVQREMKKLQNFYHHFYICRNSNICWKGGREFNINMHWLPYINTNSFSLKKYRIVQCSISLLSKPSFLQYLRGLDIEACMQWVEPNRLSSAIHDNEEFVHSQYSCILTSQVSTVLCVRSNY